MALGAIREPKNRFVHEQRSEESRRLRPFAEFILSVAEGLRVTKSVVFEIRFKTFLDPPIKSEVYLGWGVV